MGYQTTYTLSVYEGGVTIQSILDKESGETFEGLNYAVDNDGYPCDSVKWYDHEDDMLSLSKRNPGVLFKLYGEGGDSMDAWVKYFKDGKSQSCYAKITFDPYNEDALR